VVVANNQGGTTYFTMGAGAGANRVRIGAVMISQNDGTELKTLVAPVGTVSKLAVQPLQLDASLDSDVVFHEYGHGLTWRMIGGMSGPLAGAIGEGASDTVAMLVNGNDVIGEYSSSNPVGIRRARYAGYPMTYANVTGEEVHNDGEIYAAAMWRTIELYAASGIPRDTLFDYFVDGMNYTQETPAFEHMRDGMLASVAARTAPPLHGCLIWQAFAQYGIGVGASGTADRKGAVTITPSTAVPASCQ
jgi:extracellular elastinolytic metalloproteinase